MRVKAEKERRMVGRFGMSARSEGINKGGGAVSFKDIGGGDCAGGCKSVWVSAFVFCFQNVSLCRLFTCSAPEFPHHWEKEGPRRGWVSILLRNMPRGN